ncbi:FMN-binding negative transcriptional regulator [Acetobacter senegalensis]|uniref:FMN-binding negative transcriptional regulator n=1 Tax=Acetobacter senegalensis TaxID=446692 RepID=UPI00209F7EB9|nr:FMN-binding negative transcriptional regulator [Acetobacter senegalensis]MCP1197389.1 FMN-binding negative transcriptional regulator [Acetobacter senegalensis]
MNDLIAQLIGEYPLAAVSGLSTADEMPVHLPLILETSSQPSDLSHARLIGHMARRNVTITPAAGPIAVEVMFSGPQGYVSPEVAGDRGWIPTWNYARVWARGALRFSEDLTGPSLEVLVDAMEKAHAKPWQISESGPRAEALKKHIIGFEITDITFRPSFKLGQGETPAVFDKIVSDHPDRDLTRWMRLHAVSTSSLQVEGSKNRFF